MLIRNSLTAGVAGLSPHRSTSVSILASAPPMFEAYTGYLDVLDGGMITLAFYCMNLLHPGRLLGSREEWKRTRSLTETIDVRAGEKKGSYSPSAV